jgi:predicted MFS family arabinose efflux permease
MTRKNTRAAIGVFAALCSIYVVSHFYRVSNGVIAPDLMRELDLSQEAMGTLTGAFFITFSLTQIPVGIMLDRLGTRYTIPIMMTFAVVGSLIFAVAAGLAGLTVGRMLMGLGCSCVYVGALAVASRWFQTRYFATVAGILVAAGNAGNLLATKPLAEVVEVVGWRTTFVGMAGIAAIGAIIVLLFVRDAPPDHPFHSREAERLGSVLKGVGDVFRIGDLPPMLVVQFFGYASVMTILGLWGGPYLHDVYGLGLEARGSVLSVMGIGLIVGSLTFGPLDRVFDTRKGIVIGGGLFAVAILVLLAVLAKPPLWLVMTLYALLAFSNAYNIVGMAHARAIVPDRMIGRGMTVIALFTMGGVATLQIVTGLILGAFANPDGTVPEAGYRTMYGVVAACVFAGLLYYTRTSDAKPSLDKAVA